MSKYKLTVKLKQHTPIIHFQHDQAGATLRATELKPKLDRFVFKYFRKIFPDEQVEDNFLANFDPGNKVPSNYKMRVQQIKSCKRILLSSRIFDPRKSASDWGQKTVFQGVPFFAEEEHVKNLIQKEGRRGPVVYIEASELEKKVEKWGLLPEDGQSDVDVTIHIQSFSSEIIRVLKKCIPYFFAFENFGTRQNKGFGCFSVIEDGTPPFEELLKSVFTYRYRLELNIDRKSWVDQREAILRKITQDYQLLKAGRNFGGYKKSLLFLYAVTQLQGKTTDNQGNKKQVPVRWEKRKIKQVINNNQVPTPRSYTQSHYELHTKGNNSSIMDEHGTNSWQHPDDFFQYVRLALGMADQYSFSTKKLDRNGDYEYRDNGEIKPDQNKVYVAKVNSDSIDRYKSPITFKVHENTIYLLANDLDPEVEKHLKAARYSFELKFKDRNRSFNLPGNPNFQLPYPSDFKIGDFLSFALEYSNERLQNYNPFK